MDKQRKDLDFRRFTSASRKFWWVYAVCLAAFLTLAGIYAYFRMPTFNSHAKILIEDNDKTGAALAASKLNTSALGMLSLGGSSVSNEVILMNTNDLLSKAISELKMNFVYVQRNGLGKHLLFPDAPILAEVPQAVLDSLTSGFRIRVTLHNGKADIKATKGFLGYKTLAVVNNVSLPYNLHTSVCNVRLSPGKSFDKNIDAVIDINVLGTPAAVEALKKELDIETTEKKSNAILLDYTDPDRARGCAVLNTIMDQYNALRLERRRETSLNELQYCSDRLDKLFKQLSESEEKVEEFKRKNNLAALELDSASWVVRSIGAKDKLAQSQNELTFYDEVLYTLNKDKDGQTFIPASLDGRTENPLAAQYNELVLQKRDLERSATTDNPALKSINEKIRQLRSDIITNFSQIVELNKRNIGSIYSLSDEAKAKMQSIPGLERELINLLRDKTIKNELYLYLLQRREAAELRLYQTDTSGFIIDKAYADVKPNPFKSFVAFAVAILLGIIVPVALIFLLLKWTNKVSSPLDLAFIDLEDNTITAQKDSSNIRLLRTRITAETDARNIFTLDLDDEPGLTATRLLEAFANIDIPAAIVDPRNDVDNSNDTLLEKAFTEKLQRLADAGTYTISRIPDINNIKEIIPLLDKKQSLLLVILKAGATRRSRLRKLLRGIIVDRTIIYITRK